MKQAADSIPDVQGVTPEHRVIPFLKRNEGQVARDKVQGSRAQRFRQLPRTSPFTRLGGKYNSGNYLKAMLDDYQQTTGNRVIVVLEACYSGTLIPELAVPTRLSPQALAKNRLFTRNELRLHQVGGSGTFRGKHG